MTQKNQSFKRAIDKAVRLTATTKNTLIREVEAQIAEWVGYEISTIQRWRRGFLPADPEHFVFLVRYCKENGNFNQAQIQELIRCAPAEPYSARILLLEEVAELLTGKPIEIYYGMADNTGKHPLGVWRIQRGEVTSPK